MLTEVFEEHMKKLDTEKMNIKYEYFDFHAACHG